MGTRSIILTFALATLVVLESHDKIPAQESRFPQADECRTNAGEGTVYLSYERAEAARHIRKGEDRLLWLRLQNDTRCAIFVPTSEEYLMRTATGAYSFDLEDGSEVLLAYSIKGSGPPKRTTTTSRQSAPQAGSGRYVSRLPPRTSVIFSAPLREFKNGAMLEVHYAYKKDPLIGETAYFRSVQLPRELRRRLR